MKIIYIFTIHELEPSIHSQISPRHAFRSPELGGYNPAMCACAETVSVMGIEAGLWAWVGCVADASGHC